jgi:hypothetical protein
MVLFGGGAFHIRNCVLYVRLCTDGQSLRYPFHDSADRGSLFHVEMEEKDIDYGRKKPTIGSCYAGDIPQDPVYASTQRPGAEYHLKVSEYGRFGRSCTNYHQRTDRKMGFQTC